MRRVGEGFGGRRKNWYFRTISELPGHAHLQTTMICTHVAAKKSWGSAVPWTKCNKIDHETILEELLFRLFKKDIYHGNPECHTGLLF